MTPKRHRPWTPEDDRRLIELQASGRSSISIAAALKRTAAAVDGRLCILRKAHSEIVGRKNAGNEPGGPISRLLER